MTGYEPDRKVYHLKFEDMPGLEVAASSLSTGELLELDELAGEKTAAGARKLLGLFAGHLLSWNVTEKGNPVPATYEGLLTLDPAFVKAVTDGWTDAFTAVPAPLRNASSGGATTRNSLEASAPSIPMTPASPAS